MREIETIPDRNARARKPRRQIIIDKKSNAGEMVRVAFDPIEADVIGVAAKNNEGPVGVQIGSAPPAMSTTSAAGIPAPPIRLARK